MIFRTPEIIYFGVRSKKVHALSTLHQKRKGKFRLSPVTCLFYWLFRVLSLAGIARKKAGKLGREFDFDKAERNPQRFRIASLSYVPDEEGQLQMERGYKKLDSKVKGTRPFHICILIDLLQIKKDVDQRIEEEIA